MATRNSQVEPPPIWVDVLDKAGKLTQPWVTWFTKIQYFLSVDNHQSISNAATDIKLDATTVKLTATTASYAITLSPPTVSGKIKIIQMIARTNPYNVTLALTNVFGGTAATTATFDAADETLVLISVENSKWLVLKEAGVTLT